MDARLRTLPAGPPLWQAVRDQEVRKTELEAAIELRRLSEERKLLAGETARVEAELGRCGESESGVRAHRTLARWWAGLFIITATLAAVSAWWSVSWYMTLTWEKAVLAATLCVLPLVGWLVFLMRARNRLKNTHVQRLLCSLGLLIVLASATAGALLGLGRMAGVTVSEERAATAAAGNSADLDVPREVAVAADRVTWVKQILAIATAGAVILLILASEAASGLAFDEYIKRMTVVWTVAPLYRRGSELAEALAANAKAEEAARRRPEILHARLTIAGLTQEESAFRHAADEERRAAARIREAEERERDRESLGFLIRRVVIGFAVGLIVILVAAALASAREVTVVVLDLSCSTEPAEFTKNIRAVEGVILRVGAAGQITVLGIGEASFAAPLLLRESAPASPGRFGEHLDGWRSAVRTKWRRIAAGLAPGGAASDIFGALARAAEELTATSGRDKHLVILSDMRHVGRGINLERPIDRPTVLVDRVARDELLPRLDGVAVSALGVHTGGLDERHWRRLRAFWTEYLRRAGAELRAFSPNRQWGG